MNTIMPATRAASSVPPAALPPRLLSNVKHLIGKKKPNQNKNKNKKPSTLDVLPPISL